MKNLLIGFLLGFCFPVWGQNPEKPTSLSNPIPIDSSVRIGKLSNGLHFYIRRNSIPANRVEIRFIVHAGSLEEDQDQIGAAHFIAHLAFQGTLHFPKMDLQNFFKRAGMGLNPDQNARVGFEETVFSFSLPLDSQNHGQDPSSLFFKSFQLIHDWTKNLSFDESSRSLVKTQIHSEWTTGWGSNTKIRDNYFPNIFRDSRYGKRLPLGNPKWVDSLTFSRLKTFYSDWYTPDLECLVIVGDFDPESVQKHLESEFLDLKNPLQEKVITAHNIPFHRENRLALITDKEIPYTLAQWVYAQPKARMENESDLIMDLEREILNSLIRNRIKIYLKENPNNLVFANSSYIPFLGNIDTYQNQVLVKDGKGIIPGIKALATQTKIWAKYGFEPKELEEAKTEILQETFKQYQEANKRTSKSYADSYRDHYLKKAPIPGIVFQYHFIEKNLPKIQLASLNSLYKTWFLDDYPYFIVSAPEKETSNLPPAGDILQALRIKPEDLIQPKKDTPVFKPLINRPLNNTAITLIHQDSSLGIYTYILENGLEISLKPSLFHPNETVFSGIRKAGTASFSDDQYINALYSLNFVESAGMGDYGSDSLKYLCATKNIQLKPFMDEYSLGLYGKAEKNNLETALQLIYLYFTKPRKDEKAFKKQIEEVKWALEAQEKKAPTFFADTVALIMSQNNIRNRKILSSDLEKLHLDSMLILFEKAFSTPSHFHFGFVGDFDLETMKNLLGKYLGNIPIKSYPLPINKDIHEYPSPPLKRIFLHGKNPRTFIRLFYTGDIPYTYSMENPFRFIIKCLDLKLREEFKNRQLNGLNFHINGKIEHEFISRYAIEITLACNAEYADSIVLKIQNRIHDWTHYGVDTLTLNKVLKGEEIIQKKNLDANEYWLSAINEFFMNHRPFKSSLFPTLDLKFINREKSKEWMLIFFHEPHFDLRLLPEK